MGDETEISEIIICKLLEGKVNLENLISWLKNMNHKCSAHYYGLTEEDQDISQFRFILWFLKHIREKASKILNERRPKIAVSSFAASNSRVQQVEMNCSLRKYPITTTETEKKIEEEDNYLKEFPCLQEFSSKKCKKFQKRIKPTTVKNENLCPSEKSLSSSVTSSLNVKNEELLSQRFFSKQVKHTKQHYSPFDVNITYKNTSNFIPSINKNVDFKKTDKLIYLYNSLLINYLVPNITNEIRFILTIYDAITENDFLFTIGAIYHSVEGTSFLNSGDDWKYFCTNIILKQEYLISKLECNILKFVVSRMSLFTNEIPTSYLTISRDVVFAQPGCAFHCSLFTVIGLSANDFADEDDYTLFCDLKKRFLEIEKHWYSHRSETELREEIKCLLYLSSQTTHFYFLAQLFVSCLVKTIESSVTNGTNSEQKLAQLNSRLTKPLSQNDLEPDITFHSNELFFKLWVDYTLLNCPIFIHYGKYWLIHTIFKLTKEAHRELGDSLISDLRSTLLWTLKIKITLAKFLGYIEFYFNRHNNKLTQDEKKQLISIQSEVLPIFDLKSCLIEAIKSGTLVLTIPWIVEFFCMADSLCAFIPYYQDILFTFISLYLSSRIRCVKDGPKGMSFKKELLLKTSILIPQRSFNDHNDSRVEGTSIVLGESSLVFLLLWIGRLFDNKVFGESLFFETALLYQEKMSQAKFKSGNPCWKTAVDCADFVKRDVFIFCCSHFSKMKYWENLGPNYIKNIRPIPLDSENNTGSSADIQDVMEANFLLEHQSLNTLITFIVGRISAICQSQISMHVTPEKSELQGFADEIKISPQKSQVSKDSVHVEKKDSSIFMKSKILEEIMKDCENKIRESLNSLASPDLSSAVIQACITIASKKLKRQIKDWLINEGFCLEDIEHFLTANASFKESVVEWSEGGDNTGKGRKSVSPPTPYNISLSSSFAEIHKVMREIISDKSEFLNLDFFVDEFKRLSTQFQEIDERRLLKDLYIVSWDCIFLLVSNYPEELSADFLREMVNFWKENHYGDNEERILCPRIIKAASFRNNDSQIMIASNLAKLMLLNLEKEMINPESFETQSVAILRHTWTKKELHFIKMYLTTLCELFKSASVISSPRLLSTVECIIDSVNDILSLESLS